MTVVGHRRVDRMSFLDSRNPTDVPRTTRGRGVGEEVGGGVKNNRETVVEDVEKDSDLNSKSLNRETCKTLPSKKPLTPLAGHVTSYNLS